MLKYFHSSYVGLEVGLGLTQIISSFEKSVSVYQSHVFGRNSLKAVSTLSSYSATQLLSYSEGGTSHYSYKSRYNLRSFYLGGKYSSWARWWMTARMGSRTKSPNGYYEGGVGVQRLAISKKEIYHDGRLFGFEQRINPHLT